MSSVAPLRRLVVVVILIVMAGWPPHGAATPNDITNSIGMTFVLIPAGEFGPYPAEAVQDPSGPAAGAGRVIRGGSWFYPAAGARSANRSRQRPSQGRSYLGFRMACSVPSP